MFFDEVARRTEGRVTARYLMGTPIVTYGEQPEAVSTGVLDIAAANVPYLPKAYPVTGVYGSLIDLEYGSGWTAVAAGSLYRKLYEENTEVSGEFAKNNVLMLASMPSTEYVILSTKPIKKFADLEGLKVRAPGKYNLKLIGASPATAVSVPWAELFTSLQTGLIDGVFTVNDALDSVKMYEVAPYAAFIGSNLTAAPVYLIINLDVWNTIPAKDQKIMMEVGLEVERKGFEMTDAKTKEVYAKWQADPNVTVTVWSDEEIAKFVAASPDWYPMIIDELNESGLSGEKIVNRITELQTQFHAGKWKP